jgi:XTP/dITP diphosphohydrolase
MLPLGLSRFARRNPQRWRAKPVSTIVLATASQGKIIEFATLLAPLGWSVRPQTDWNLAQCPEPHLSFVENALAKARHAALHTGLPALADDSGLCVTALGGAPGVRSARYACESETDTKNDAANNTKLLQALHNETQRAAYFVCALVAVTSPIDPEPLIAIGRWHGHIALQASGHNGFGYDPLFVCKQTQVSAATMSVADKASMSHRGLAVRQMIALMQTTWLVQQ